MRAFYIALIFLLMSVSCVQLDRSNSELPKIDIEKELGNFKILNLTDFASTVRYVPLETHEDFLVANVIENIYVEDNKIFVHDSEPFLKVFDAESGKHLYNVGAKGQGPGELPYMYSVDINLSADRILLCWSNFVHCFDFAGNFLGKIEIPPIADNEMVNPPIAILDSNCYVGTIKHYGSEQKNLLILFNNNQEVIDSLSCYENPIQPSNIKGGVWSPFAQGGMFYRTENQIRYYRGFTDTVYAFNKDLSMFLPYFVMDYGKHKSKLNFSKDAENPDLIMISSIRENNKYIFLDFETRKASPEPFEDEIFRGGRWIKFSNQAITGIFNKKTRAFYFLLQPFQGIPGIKNDIDGGIPFIVRNVSNNNQLIDYYHAYKFLELAEKLPNKGDLFLKVVSGISEEDNPIVIIAE